MKNFLVYNGKKDGYNFEISADKNSISGVPPEKKISRLIDENIDYVSGVFYLPTTATSFCVSLPLTWAKRRYGHFCSRLTVFPTATR